MTPEILRKANELQNKISILDAAIKDKNYHRIFIEGEKLSYVIGEQVLIEILSKRRGELAYELSRL